MEHWVNQKYNFDNLGQALITLFVLASKDGWVSIMYTGLDAVGIDQQPQQNYNEWRLIYFISFLLLVGFFVLNMFVGVVVENFHKCRESQEKEEKARRAEKRQHKLDQKRRRLQQCPYWAKYGKTRLIIYTVINSKYFDLAIAGVIGLNVITMAMEFYMMPKELEFSLQIFNYFFTSVFILEAVMKIVALGILRYLRDRWNQLDIFIVILSIVGIILEEMKTNVIPINPTIIRVMRVLRIARVLKLLKMAKGIRSLLDTVIQALPQVGNLGLLFFLLFFIFAALGVELFGRLECSEKHPCEGLSEHAHFRNFGRAFLTLFRVATGDNWNGIMKDTLRTDCDSSDSCLQNCCVNHIIAPVYFVVFVLMAQFVLVNVVVAVLMKHLEETYKYKELDDEVEEELKLEMDEMRKNVLQDNFEMAKIQESHKMVDGEAELEELFRKQVKLYATAKQNASDDDKLEADRSIPPPSFTFRPPSCEPCPPSPTTSLWTSGEHKDMYMDPTSISVTARDDNNTLKVPSVSAMDGRLILKERHFFNDDSTEYNSANQSTISSPTVRINYESSCIVRPASDQYLISKTRKEKAVSWYSKLPTSTQTLKCADRVTDEMSSDDKHAQSQPLLSTLCGITNKKPICRNTNSVKQIRSKSKDQPKARAVRRCQSSGNEKSKNRDNYLQLKNAKRTENYSSASSLSPTRTSKTSESGFKHDTTSHVKNDELSLIDWEEDDDDNLCDEEVGNITEFLADVYDDDLRQMMRQQSHDNDLNNSSSLTEASSNMDVGPYTRTICDSHSKDVLHKLTGDDSKHLCDHSTLTYALSDSLSREAVVMSPISSDSQLLSPTNCTSESEHCFLNIPDTPQDIEFNACSATFHNGTLHRRKTVQSDEQRPPLNGEMGKRESFL